MSVTWCKHGKTNLVYCADCKVGRLQAELEQVKAERDQFICILPSDMALLHEELSAKNKVLEWYGCGWAYLRHYVKHGDGENIISDSEVQQDKGTKARSILSQYGDTHE